MTRQDKLAQAPLMDWPSESFLAKFRRWRRAVKARMPYVRRRNYTLLATREQKFIDDILLRSCHSNSAAITAVKAWGKGLDAEEVCFFVTHASQPALKEHVTAHLQLLIEAGISVVLILNTDLTRDDFAFDPSLIDQLRAVYVRANLGFDFAAWSHLWKITEGLPGCKRLYLTNDSIIGPLDAEPYRQIIQRVRESNADVVGLTEAPQPRPHLQSYFLAVQGKALRSKLFTGFIDNLLCLPTKDMVIATYETRLTGYLRAAGFRCESLFSGPIPGGHTENDTHHRWAELINCGFPFIKSSVLTLYHDDPRVPSLVPAKFRGG